MRAFDWIALCAWGVFFGGALILSRRTPRPAKPRPMIITLDMDQLMPGEVWKCTTARYDLAILSYEDLETMCERSGYVLKDRGARKAVWQPK